MGRIPFLLVFLLGMTTSSRSNEVVRVSSEAVVEVSEADFSTDDVFVATEEWQEIRPGQAIPKGEIQAL